MNYNFEDLTGRRFGYLTVISRDQNPNNKRVKWLCVCNCNKLTTVSACDLKSGHTSSCGCKKFESHNKRHGMTKTRIHTTWLSMRSRCYDKKCQSYPYYGGRGITVCDEWKDSFESFYSWAISNGYTDELLIDRIDNNKGYSPNNCRWVTMNEQNNNRRNNIFLEYDGAINTLANWCKILNLNYRHYHTIYYKHFREKSNVTLDDILNYKPRSKKRGKNSKFFPRKTKSKLMQFSLDGQLIKIWDSSAEAERVAGFNAKAIRNCCCGLSESSGGYIWKFVNS